MIAIEDPVTKLTVYDTATGKPLHVIDDRDGIGWLEFSPDGRKIATGITPYQVDLWEVATGKRQSLLPSSPATSEKRSLTYSNLQRDWQCHFSPDGRTLLTSWNGAWVHIWDLALGREVLPLGPAEGRQGRGILPGSSPVSPDGRLLVRNDTWNDCAVGVWEMASGQKVCRLKGRFSSATFSPDGRMLAAGCEEDSSILLWDLHELLGGDRSPTSAVSWDDLASADAARAIRGVIRLAHDEKLALALLGPRLRPVTRPAADEVAALLKDLDSPLFASRDKASERLAELGESVAADLKSAEPQGSAEARHRVKRLLERLQPGSGDRLRELRAVQVLRRVNSAAARDLLRRLASGAPEALLTRAAKEAIGRLSR